MSAPAAKGDYVTRSSCGCNFVEELRARCLNCGKCVDVGDGDYHLYVDMREVNVFRDNYNAVGWPQDKCLFGAGYRLMFDDAVKVTPL